MCPSNRGARRLRKRHARRQGAPRARASASGGGRGRAEASVNHGGEAGAGCDLRDFSVRRPTNVGWLSHPGTKPQRRPPGGLSSGAVGRVQDGATGPHDGAKAHAPGKPSRGLLDLGLGSRPRRQEPRRALLSWPRSSASISSTEVRRSPPVSDFLTPTGLCHGISSST